ncbi:hypothetical protein HYFRA_00006736 [Hymenoscyphus fraxineus]|uniref:Heterokaryon incompatibility domain-containing protein n=1 Tax=Hymenoscyphus fraxineus TaxID=746836 RepID=A0A9N9KUQ8_9HELO|nr:hypothetical protein HYFRA_00006736 [Hymenoscyphus fraxineus]
MLCALCISMFQNVDTTLEGDHHATVEDLVKAAESGCRICTFENMRRVEFGTEEDNAIKERPLLRYEFQAKESPYDHLYWRIKFKSSAIWAIDLFPGHLGSWNEILLHVDMMDVAPIPPDYDTFLESTSSNLAQRPWYVARDYFPTREISSSTGGHESFEVASHWLRECQESHQLCKNTQRRKEHEWYPKRLIAVGEDDNNVRLFIAAKEQPVSGYAALSHCWGTNPNFLTLTSDTCEQFQQNIPSKLIPKSFRDAISTCRYLDIHYIWIDSLCIIQSGVGSSDDWMHHATEMDRIYSNCLVNLSIVHASNPNEGAFVERNPDFLQDCYLWSPLASPTIEDLSSNSPNDRSILDRSSNVIVTHEQTLNPKRMYLCTIFACSMDFCASRIGEPLTSRGWVLQERLLSTRALHFQKDRIAWECEEGSRSEYFPFGFPCGHNIEEFSGYYKPIFSLDNELKQSLQPELERTTIGQEKRRSISALYNSLVDDYTRRNLSHPAKDKLVAFSAVAKRFGSKLGHRYLAGMFRDDMPLNLLWGGYQTSRQEEWRAPSWSWASLDGRVLRGLGSYIAGGVGDRTVEILADIVEVEVKLVDPGNQYGQVKSGKLFVRCIVLPWNPDDEHLSYNGDTKVGGAPFGSAKLSPENPSEELFDYFHACCCYHRCLDDILTINFDGGRSVDEPKLNGCFLFPLFESLERTYDADISDIDEPRVAKSSGLILLKQNDGFYTRLGLYSSKNRCLGREAIERGVERQIITIV